MANVKIVNEVPPVPQQVDDHYMMWRLTQEMQNAGWVVNASSDGTTKTTGGAGWLTYADSHNLHSWCALSRPGNAGHGFLFWFRNVGDRYGFNVPPSAWLNYTTDGWNMTGTSATVPPVANGVTHTLRGQFDGVADKGGAHWFGSGGPNSGPLMSQVVKRMNFFLYDSDDDHSIVAYGFNDTTTGVGGYPQLCHMFGYSVVETKATQVVDIGDPYVFLTSDLWGRWPDIGGGNLRNAHYFSSEPLWHAVSYNNTLVQHTAAVLYDPIRTYLHTRTNLYNRYQGTLVRYLEPIYIWEDVGGKGFLKHFRAFDPGVSGDTTTDLEWVCVRTANALWLPWDGVTATMLF